MLSNFGRSNIDHYLYQIAKEYKKYNRNNSYAEIILIGGTSAIINYNFRDTTTDIDAVIKASSTIKEIINQIGDNNDLANGWLNDNFKNTDSYSPYLSEYSKYYKTFCNCLTIRTISAEYLIAMKICSLREYKHDISDIIGIIKEHIELNKKISYTDIEKAYFNLYKESIPLTKKEILQNIYAADDIEELFYNAIELENKQKNSVIAIEKEYGQSIAKQYAENLNDIPSIFQNKNTLNDNKEDNIEL